MDVIFSSMHMWDRHEAMEEYFSVVELVEQSPPEKGLQLIDLHLSADPSPDVRVLLLRDTAPLLIGLGRPDEALRRLDRSVAESTALWGGADARTLLLRNSQMYWAGKTGMRRRAEALAEDLLADARRHLSRKEDLFCVIRNNVARILESGTTPEVADALYKELLEDLDAWGQQGRSFALSARHNYGEYLRDSGDLDGAIVVFQKLLLILTEFRGIASRDTLAVRNDLAAVHSLAGNREQAQNIWRALLTDINRFLDSGDPLEPEVLGSLLTEAVEAEDRSEAIAWADRLLEIYREIDEPALMAALVEMRGQIVESNA